jgi:hypothetical protein
MDEAVGDGTLGSCAVIADAARTKRRAATDCCRAGPVVFRRNGTDLLQSADPLLLYGVR